MAFTVQDTIKADYRNQQQKLREGERKFGEKVPFTDMDPPISRILVNQAGEQQASGLMSHPIIANDPRFGMSDPRLSVDVPHNPDGSINYAELQHDLAMRKSKKFNPNPSAGR